MPSQSVPLGTGIYYPAEAARLISIRPDRLRRWVRGYTYWTHDARRGRKHSRPPILSRARRGRGGDLPVIDRAIALSFLELMELRIVRELVDDHLVPLQKVRKFADQLKAQFDTKYPFASRQVGPCPVCRLQRLSSRLARHQAPNSKRKLRCATGGQSSCFDRWSRPTHGRGRWLKSVTPDRQPPSSSRRTIFWTALP